MKNTWLIIAVLFPLVSLSQGNISKKGLVTVTSVGFAAGESTAKPLFHLSGGFAFDRWFAGAGIGYDQYRYNSFPLYADCRMNLGEKRQAFLYANGGYNFSARGNKNENDFFKTTDVFGGGFYMDAGVGYKVRLNAIHHMLFSAGFSQKQMYNKVGYTYVCFSPPCLEDISYYHYSFGRIVMKLSWEFSQVK